MFGLFRKKVGEEWPVSRRLSVERQVAQLEQHVTALRIVVEFMTRLTPPEQRAEMIKQLKAAVGAGYAGDAPWYDDPLMKQDYKNAVSAVFQGVIKESNH
jgi:hypothetical protein